MLFTFRDSQLPKGKGKILHSFMMGTKSFLCPKENVAVMHFMEEQVLRLAKQRAFEGIFTTNTSPLTQVCLWFPDIIISFTVYFDNFTITVD